MTKQKTDAPNSKADNGPDPVNSSVKKRRAPTSSALNAEYRRLSEKPVVGFYILQRGRLRHVNAQLADILGYEHPAALIGKSFWELVHPDDRALVRLRKGQETTQPDSADHLFRVLKPDGTAIQVILRGDNTPYDGQPANVGCLIDMTTIGRLQEYRDKYWAMINEVQDVVAEIDLNGIITFYNEAARRVWNVSDTELLGKSFLFFMDPPSAEIARQAYTKVYQTGLPGKNIVYEIIRTDGQRMVVEDCVTLIRNYQGTVTGFRTVSRDITGRREAERKRSEQRAHLEAVFRSVKDAIITVDPQLRVIEANAPMEKICGLETGTIKGTMLPQCPLHCKAACHDVLRQTLAQHTAIRDFRVECGVQERPQQMVNVSSSPLLDSEGNFMGAVLVIRDITRLGDLERELRQRHTYQNVIGKSKQMQDLYRLVEDLADLEITVLISGESGTGKNLIAKALHYSGRRAFKPFVTVNCSVLAESLLESELFGHVKGAFTGAVQDKQGRFQAADGGTLLLDEIGDVSPFIQLKLLRVLQEKEFERVGESMPRKVDVRIIACTNKDLKKKVKNGEFREDLYYRLKVMEITLPPLRERLEDIPLLVEHFQERFNKKFNRTIEGLHDEALALFMDYAWPGNVRELEHAIERAFVICNEKRIATSHLPPEITDPQRLPQPDAPADQAESEENIKRILDALSRSFWNKSKAAGMLGMSRQTLYRKMNAYRMFDKEVN